MAGNIKQIQEGDELSDKLLREALAFAASCIKSGEPWSETCEQIIGAALAERAVATPAPLLCRSEISYTAGGMRCCLPFNHNEMHEYVKFGPWAESQPTPAPDDERKHVYSAHERCWCGEKNDEPIKAHSAAPSQPTPAPLLAAKGDAWLGEQVDKLDGECSIIYDAPCVKTYEERCTALKSILSNFATLLAGAQEASESLREEFTLTEITLTSLSAGLHSSHWNPLEKQLTAELLKKMGPRGVKLATPSPEGKS